MKKPEKLRAVLIDRDGVINEEPGPILKPEAFRFVPGSIEAVARINQAGWLCLLVTNQAALARGQMDLGNFPPLPENEPRTVPVGSQDGRHVFRPHHPDWDAGKKRSSPKNCGCRKPEPGLLEKPVVPMESFPRKR